MKRLIPVILMLVAQQAYSQKFTQADIVGKYTIVKIAVDDTLIVDYSSEKAFTDLYMQQMNGYLAKNPGIDTTGASADAKASFLKGSVLTITFDKGGDVIMANPMGTADTTAKWTFDKDKQQIGFVEPSGLAQTIVPQWQGKKPFLTIIGNNDPRNRVIIVKE
jgi:hypothetical protein